MAPDAPIIESAEPEKVMLTLPPGGPYIIRRKDEFGAWQHLASGVNDTYEDTDVLPGKTYSYAIRLDDGEPFRESEVSDEVDAEVPEEPTVDDLEALGLDDIDMNDPEQKQLVLAILRGDVGPAMASDMHDEADGMENGDDSSADDWFMAAAGLLGIGVILAGIVGAGGLNNFDQAAQDSTEGKLLDQLDYLDGAADQLAGDVFGKPDQSVDSLDSRLDKYGNALGTVAEGVLYDEQVANGVLWARRLLCPDPGVRHCEGCIAMAEEGWMPVDEMPPIGTDCECGSNCLCGCEYSSEQEMPEDDEAGTAGMSANLISHGAEPEFAARFANLSKNP